MATEIAEYANIAPNPWPNECLVDLNDFDLYSPRGNNVFGGSGVYGFQPQGTDPIKDGPLADPVEGSVVYFEYSRDEPLMGLMTCLGIHRESARKPNKQYAVFHKTSKQPEADGYYNQIRIVSSFGLKYGFRAIGDKEYETYPEQPLSIPELIMRFVQEETRRWRGFLDSSGTDIGGTFGGDGHFAQEGLSFGLMVENGYYHVYRVWSRAWLITK